MFGIRVFGTQKPRQFNFHARYWDREADEKEQRRREVLGDKYVDGGKNYEPGSLIREAQLRRLSNARRTQSKSKTTLIRGLLFVGMVFVILYLITNFYGKIEL
ncbi:MAG: hypothetical protein R3Y19_04470 [Rikenellaceae bacterium]